MAFRFLHLTRPGDKLPEAYIILGCTITMQVESRPLSAFAPTRPALFPHLIIRGVAIALCGLVLNACSMGQMVARSSLSILDSGNIAMNRETDLELARAAIDRKSV